MSNGKAFFTLASNKKSLLSCPPISHILRTAMEASLNVVSESQYIDLYLWPKVSTYIVDCPQSQFTPILWCPLPYRSPYNYNIYIVPIDVIFYYTTDTKLIGATWAYTRVLYIVHHSSRSSPTRYTILPPSINCPPSFTSMAGVSHYDHKHILMSSLFFLWQMYNPKRSTIVLKPTMNILLQCNVWFCCFGKMSQLNEFEPMNFLQCIRGVWWTLYVTQAIEEDFIPHVHLRSKHMKDNS
jgi:hypothetical protein